MKLGDVLEVAGVSGDERHLEFQSSGGDDRVAKTHLLLLPQDDRAPDDFIVQGCLNRGGDDLVESGLPLRREMAKAGKSENLDAGDAGDERIRAFDKR